ncbi:MAG: sugar ABC transporter ATP-binding protein [Solirubrobacterales bacterium]
MYLADDISKRYAGVRALQGVSLEIHPGEVHALLGANGAGKSSLVKILVGAERPSGGRLLLDGDPVAFSDPTDAAGAGVAIVSQELTMFPDLDVLENLFLRREPRHAGVLLDRAEMARRAREVMAIVGLRVELGRAVGTLRLGEQQLLEVARALLGKPRYLFLDEPTSALQAAETEHLLKVVRDLRDSGVGIVYVSHFLEDVFAVADTVTVLRDARVVVSRRPVAGMSIREAVIEMVGSPPEQERSELRAPRPRAGFGAGRGAAPGPLRISGLAVRGRLEPFDLEARPGEIVGLAGLEGSGPREVLDAVFGRRRPDAGRIELPGGAGRLTSMTAAVRAGVAFVPADRKRLGVMLDKTIYENVALVSSGPLRRMGVLLRRGTMWRRAEFWRQALRIKMASPAARVGELSGGNQQKVVFAKWLETEPNLILLDDPSRGVDVGAKAEMHAIVVAAAAEGKIVLVASSDLDELAILCDRVLVFFQGRLRGELAAADLSEHRLLEAINTGELARDPVAPGNH